MKDAIVMWREPRLVVLTAVGAAVYVAALLPFKVLVIFPGLAEVRPAAALPVVLSFLFGPAGAWGAAFGNLIGDILGGMLGPGSIFGFVANFVYGYAPYKLWQALAGERSVSEEVRGWKEKLPAPLMSGQVWAVGSAAVFTVALVCFYFLPRLGIHVEEWLSWKVGEETRTLGLWPSIVLFSIVTVIGVLSFVLLLFSPPRVTAVIFFSALACADILGWAIDLLGFFPFRVFASWILLNNTIVSLLLAPPVLLLLHSRAAQLGLLYTDLFPPAVSRQRLRVNIGLIIFISSIVILFVGGSFIPQEMWLEVFGSGERIWRAGLFFPFVAGIWLGLALLSD